MLFATKNLPGTVKVDRGALDVRSQRRRMPPPPHRSGSIVLKNSLGGATAGVGADVAMLAQANESGCRAI